MKARVLLGAVFILTALSGCFGGGGEDPDTQATGVPGVISDEEVERLEKRALAEFPNTFTFPGQQAQPPRVLFFNDTLAQGTAATGQEFPHDDGPVDRGAEFIAYDLTSEVPAGQPVEIRMKLQWQGNPGASADLDIYVNAPGIHDAYQESRYDESWNWNVVTKTRVVNTVHVEGQPLEVGIQVQNGKEFADEVPYSLQAVLYYPGNVLAPRIPYAIQVPEGASGLIFESEPMAGDEHITSDFLVIDPDDRLWAHKRHNDIGTETLFVPVNRPGEYIVYAHSYEGGFLRVEADVENANHTARILETQVDERVLHSGAPAPGTYAEMCVPSATFNSGLATDDPVCLGSTNSFGDTGSFDVEGAFPLDVRPFVRTSSGAVNAAINVTSEAGWVGTAYAFANQEDGQDRFGWRKEMRQDRSSLAGGAYEYGVVVNGGAPEMGVEVLTYVR